MNQTIRTYSELIKLGTFAERYNYLRLTGNVGEQTFGRDRWLNQIFYNSAEWRRIRREVLIRDFGCDLGVPGCEFAPGERVIIHHMNPIMLEDLLDQDRKDLCMNPEYLISTCTKTHNAIHYGATLPSQVNIVERFPNDTCPWKH